MSKLIEMFIQARRAQSGGGIGFIGKNRQAGKPRAAAVVVTFATPDASLAESAIKAGADGLLFDWDGEQKSLEALKKAIEAAQTGEEKVISGLHITGGYDAIDRETFEHLKKLHVAYVILPMHAPARLLALQVKDLELVVAVPMQAGDMYPIFMRNLTAFEGLAAVRLDFDLHLISDLTIENVLRYRAVRDAVRFPAMLNVESDISEADAYTLLTLGVQAMIITANKSSEKTKQSVKQMRELLERVYHEDKDSKESFGLTPSSSRS
ncbi:MAG TPA: hypothetical protein VNE38_04395 [Ktedonobacteraceae bacterium]|nr:hypothetical protein [Ktedonobacteraceae bacterium]